jgi:outer membrane protein OmpA-like peptidoglycan-associated protein
MSKKISWLSGMIVFWFTLSSFWYTCLIKELCVQDRSYESSTQSKEYIFYFAPDSSELLPQNTELLNNLSSYLKISGKKAEILGHTNFHSNQSYSQALGQMRAKNVYDFLVSSGVPKTQLTTKSLSYTKPVVQNWQNGDERFNRRVEVITK